MITEGLIGAASGAIVLLIGKLIEWYRARGDQKIAEKKADADVQKSAAEQALAMYKGLIDELKADMEKLLEHLHESEEERLKCREENAMLRAQVSSLTDRVQQLEAAKAK